MGMSEGRVAVHAWRDRRGERGAGRVRGQGVFGHKASNSKYQSLMSGGGILTPESYTPES